MAEVLAITRGHLGERIVDRITLATGVDARASAVVAPCHRYLITRPPLVVGSAQSSPRNFVQQHVIVDIAAELRPNRGLGITEERHRLGPHFEPKLVLDQAGSFDHVSETDGRLTHID